MALIQWNQEFSVGIGKFDEQHKSLFAVINDLHDALEQGRGNDMLKETLDKLAVYTKTHFAEEESLLEKYNYPYLSEHRREHEKLAAQVTKLQNWQKTNEILLTPVVMEFLIHWLSDHIYKIDKRYKQFLNDLGVQ